MRRKCFVTGAGGFLGRMLCSALNSHGYPVNGLSSHSAAPCCDKTYSIDITQPLVPTVFEGVDVVFHLAGKVHALSEVGHEDEEYFRVNTLGTRHVLEAAQAAGVRRFVFFSTVKVMSRDAECAGGNGTEVGGRRVGVLKERALTEEDGIEPDTPYGRSKLEAEKLVLHGGYVPEPVVLRLCMVYGPGGKGNMQKMLHAVRRRRFPPLPETANRRSMVHVQDVIQAAMLAAEKPEAIGQVFIVSDGSPYSTRQIFELMCHAWGRGIPKWTVPLGIMRGLGRTGDLIGKIRGRRFVFDSDALYKLIGSAWFSSHKLETMLGFKPLWNLEKALPEIVSEMRGVGKSSDGPAQ